MAFRSLLVNVCERKRKLREGKLSRKLLLVPGRARKVSKTGFFWETVNLDNNAQSHQNFKRKEIKLWTIIMQI